MFVEGVSLWGHYIPGIDKMPSAVRALLYNILFGKYTKTQRWLGWKFCLKFATGLISLQFFFLLSIDWESFQIVSVMSYTGEKNSNENSFSKIVSVLNRNLNCTYSYLNHPMIEKYY